MKDELLVNSEQSWAEFVVKARQMFEHDKYLRIRIDTGKQRTLTENASLHLYCEHLAHALNDAGFDQRQVMDKMKEGVEVPWSKDTIKDNLWRPIQQAMIQKESTVEAHRADYGRIYDVLNRWTSNTFGISVPWPCKETQREAA